MGPGAPVAVPKRPPAPLLRSAPVPSRVHIRSQSACTNVPVPAAAEIRAHPATNPIAPAFCVSNPRVLQMTVTDIVGGSANQVRSGSGSMGWNFLVHLPEIPRAAKDALFGIGGVGTLASLAESTVSCISPFAPDEEAALGFHFDSWYPMAANKRQS